MFGRTCRSFALFTSVQFKLLFEWHLKEHIKTRNLCFPGSLLGNYLMPIVLLLRTTYSTGVSLILFKVSIFLLSIFPIAGKTMDKRRRKQAKTSSCSSEGEFSSYFFPFLYQIPFWVVFYVVSTLVLNGFLSFSIDVILKVLRFLVKPLMGFIQFLLLLHVLIYVLLLVFFLFQESLCFN